MKHPIEEKAHRTDGRARAAAALLAAELGAIGWTPKHWCGIREKQTTRVFRGVWYARAQRGNICVYLAREGGYFGRRRGGVDGPVVRTPQEAAETAPLLCCYLTSRWRASCTSA